MTWRVIDTGLLSGAENLAWDQALLRARAEGLIPDTLRYLRFSPPVALVGYHQAVEEEIRTDYCREQGIEINRRITGGGAIYFDEGRLGWELIASREAFPGGPAWPAINQAVCEAAAFGLRCLGVAACFRPRNDIEVEGRKISGTGAVLEGEALLFQGTLLVDFHLEHLIKALRIPTEKLNARELSSARERVTSLREQLGYRPSLAEIRQGLEKGFRDKLGIRAVRGEILPLEREYVAAALPALRSQEWIGGRRTPFRPRQILRSIHKEKGGLIRTAVKVDHKQGVIKDILITGDFFIHPRRTMYDLEAFLKDTPIRHLQGNVEQFFSASSPEILGLTGDDFRQAIQLALEKGVYPNFGFTLEEADQLSVFGGTLAEILSRSDLLLLPYCSKLPDCGYRLQQGCGRCGACTIGEAWTLAEEQGLAVKTIQNYEHLVESLEQEKRKGTRAYLGCCCDAFQLKRQEAFKLAGLPGLLMDIENTTCYELGREKEAYRGGFENQTHLRLDLLTKVLAARKKVYRPPAPGGQETGFDGPSAAL